MHTLVYAEFSFANAPINPCQAIGEEPLTYTHTPRTKDWHAHTSGSVQLLRSLLAVGQLRRAFRFLTTIFKVVVKKTKRAHKLAGVHAAVEPHLGASSSALMSGKLWKSMALFSSHYCLGMTATALDNTRTSMTNSTPDSHVSDTSLCLWLYRHSDVSVDIQTQRCVCGYTDHNS